jgi:hypothetical protein
MALIALFPLPRWKSSNSWRVATAPSMFSPERRLVERREHGGEVDGARVTVQSALRIEMKQRPHAPVLLGTRAEGKQRAMRMEVRSRKLCERFEIGLQLLSRLLLIRQVALEQPDERAGASPSAGKQPRCNSSSATT